MSLSGLCEKPAVANVNRRRELARLGVDRISGVQVGATAAAPTVRGRELATDHAERRLNKREIDIQASTFYDRCYDSE